MKSVDYRKLTPKQRWETREAYIIEQDGFCMYCKAKLRLPPSEDVQKMSVDKSRFPRGFFDYPIHLQHNHKTGMTEGAVHAYCNAVLWQYHNR